jgi:hypothetical protein
MTQASNTEYWMDLSKLADPKERHWHYYRPEPKPRSEQEEEEGEILGHDEEGNRHFENRQVNFFG